MVLKDIKEYKDFHSGKGDWSTFWHPITVRGGLYYRLMATDPYYDHNNVAPSDMVDFAPAKIAGLSGNTITAEKQRWSIAAESLQKIQNEANAKVNQVINDFEKLMTPDNSIPETELNVVKQTYSEATQLRNALLEQAAQTLKTVKEYPTLSEFQSATKSVNGSALADSQETMAKQGVLGKASSILKNRTTLIIIGAVALLLIYFMFLRKK